MKKQTNKQANKKQQKQKLQDEDFVLRIITFYFCQMKTAKKVE